MTFLDGVADAGRLRVAPTLAAHLLFAAVIGVTLTLIGLPEDARDAELSPRLRDALVGSLTTEPPPSAGPGSALASRALSLDVALTHADDTALPLRSTETALLHDWLHQLAR